MKMTRNYLKNNIKLSVFISHLRNYFAVSIYMVYGDAHDDVRLYIYT